MIGLCTPGWHRCTQVGAQDLGGEGRLGGFFCRATAQVRPGWPDYLACLLRINLEIHLIPLSDSVLVVGLDEEAS